MQIFEKDVALVSVVLSTFNRCGVLKDTISSIEAQDYPSLEIVIVNDGSSDGTEAFLKQFKCNKKFHVITNPRNLGLQASLNIGISQAKGMYIARIDDHDLWTRMDKISKQVQYLQTHPRTGIVGTGFISNRKVYRNPLSDEAIRRQILFRCPFEHSSVVFLREIWEELGGYNEGMEYAEDWEFWLRIGQRYRLANLPNIAVQKEHSTDGLTAKYGRRQFHIVKGITKKYRRGYKNYYIAVLYRLIVSAFFHISQSNSPLQKTFHRIFRAVFLAPSNDL